MELLKDFAESVNEVPQVWRVFACFPVPSLCLALFVIVFFPVY